MDVSAENNRNRLNDTTFILHNFQFLNLHLAQKHHI